MMRTKSKGWRWELKDQSTKVLKSLIKLETDSKLWYWEINIGFDWTDPFKKMWYCSDIWYIPLNMATWGQTVYRMYL